jgi:outer membrane protein assembly factor BamB
MKWTRFGSLALVVATPLVGVVALVGVVGLVVIVAIVAVTTLTTVTTVAANGQTDTARWAQWRGTDGAGVSTDPALPTTWSPTTHIAWKTPIPGRAHSSPIVWRDRVFLTTAIEGEEMPDHTPLPHTIGGQPWRHPDATAGNKRHALQVMAIDAASGEVLWTRTAYEGPVYDDRHAKSSYAAHTPVTNGELVFAYFGSEGLYAYRFDGTLAWEATVGKLGSLSVGLGVSPVLYRDLVIVQADEDNGDTSSLVAFNTKTGQEAWRVARPGLSVSWGTPVLSTSGGQAQIITAANEQIVSYDPATGRELWREAGLDTNAVPSPVLAGDLVIISAGYPLKRTVAFRLNPPAGTPRRAWNYDKGTAYVVSPIVYGDYLYVTTDNGILTCLDVKTGNVVYGAAARPRPPRSGRHPSRFAVTSS